MVGRPSYTSPYEFLRSPDRERDGRSALACVIAFGGIGYGEQLACLDPELLAVPIAEITPLHLSREWGRLADGVDIATVSERMGHSSVRVTAEIYSHALRGRDDEAARRWEQFQRQHVASHDERHRVV